MVKDVELKYGRQNFQNLHSGGRWLGALPWWQPDSRDHLSRRLVFRQIENGPKWNETEYEQLSTPQGVQFKNHQPHSLY